MKLLVCALVIVGGLVGCGPSEGSFASDFARENCKLQEECYPVEFDAQFDDLGDCAEQVEDFFDDLDLGEGCTFDRGEARRCLNEIRGLSCEEAEQESDACEEVYTECGDQQGEDTDN